MSKIKPHLDRLSQSLTHFGFSPKRTQLLEIAAQAFGYRNSNETNAAAKRGDLDPPEAKALGQVTIDGHTLYAFEDPTSLQPFATPAKEGDILIAPLGGLVRIPALARDLAQLTETVATKEGKWVVSVTDVNHMEIAAFTGFSEMEVRNNLGHWAYIKDKPAALKFLNETDLVLDHEIEDEIIKAYFAKHGGQYSIGNFEPSTSSQPSKGQEKRFIAMIHHKYGNETFSATTEDEFYLRIATWCRDWWKDAPENARNEINLDTATNREIVDAYFFENENEFLDLGEESSVIPAAPIKSPTRPPSQKIQVAVIHANAGRTTFSAETKDQLLEQVAQWCKATDPDSIDNDPRSIVDMFFLNHEKMTIDIIEVDNPFPAPIPKTITIHVAEIHHNHGTDLRVALTKKGIDKAIASYARDNLERGSDDMSDDDVTAAYFDKDAEEYVEETIFEIDPNAE